MERKKYVKSVNQMSESPSPRLLSKKDDEIKEPQRSKVLKKYANCFKLDLSSDHTYNTIEGTGSFI